MIKAVREPPDWIEAALPELAERFTTIRRFLEACRKLNDAAWILPPARLYLATRPPSYFDIARRLLYRVETAEGFAAEVFEQLLAVVNAIRGTHYQDPIGSAKDRHTVTLPWTVTDDLGRTSLADERDPTLVLGNLVVADEHWERASRRTLAHPHGRPVHSLPRLLGLVRILTRATFAAKPRRGSGRTGAPTLLVLPELSVPRRWFRSVAQHIVRHGG